MGEALDQVFSDVVAWNSEGDIVFGADGSIGVPWRREAVYRLLAAEPLAPAAQACVELAWHHQDLLLGQHRSGSDICAFSLLGPPDSLAVPSSVSSPRRDLRWSDSSTRPC